MQLYMSQAMSAASTTLARDYSMILIPVRDAETDVADLGIEGVLICDPTSRNPLIGRLDELGLPVVTIERRLDRPDDPWHVRADNEGDTLLLLEHLANAGAQRVAMLSLDADIAWVDETTGAYRAWCADRGQDPIVVSVDPRALESNAYTMAGRLLGGPDPPDAIYASAELFISETIRAAREHGLSVPDDLMVACGIDDWNARESDPPATSIDVHPEIQGAAAAEMLIARIEGADVDAPQITPSELHIRESTRRGPVRVSADTS